MDVLKGGDNIVRMHENTEFFEKCMDRKTTRSRIQTSGDFSLTSVCCRV